MNIDPRIGGRWDEYVAALLRITVGGSRYEDPRRIGEDYHLSAAEVYAISQATPEQRERAIQAVVRGRRH